jgi:hypothetical protein
MSFALNEIEATAKRAARGAGLSWGMAEEASKATRWLCAQGIDGAAVLAAVLEQTEGKPASDMRPQSLSGEWQAEGGRLCPLLAGASLSDCAAGLADARITLQTVSHPAMLLPFAAAIAGQLGQTVTLEWEGCAAVTDGRAVSIAGDALLDAKAAGASASLGGTLGTPMPQATRAAPDAAAWESLNRFAHRTFAPATEASRLAGAGAGLSDND